MIAQVLLFGPLLLAVVAVALSLWAGMGISRVATAMAIHADRLVHRSAVHLAAVKRLPHAVVAVAPVGAKDYVAAPIAPAVEETPLEKLKRPGLEWIASFKLELLRCASNAGVEVGDLAAGARRLESLVKSLTSARDAAEVDEVRQETSVLAVEIVQVLVSKCDHDLDPECRNAPLQSSIAELVKLSGLTLYLPEMGTPVDKRLHISLGVGDRAGTEMRGSVASVRARGLLDAQGAVVARAEVREYD